MASELFGPADRRIGYRIVVGSFPGYSSASVLTNSAGTEAGTSANPIYTSANNPNLAKRVVSSAASGNPDFLKASAGQVSQFWGSCGATAAFLQIYNKASAPTIGTDTPVLTFPIPAVSNFTQTLPNGGFSLSAGISFAFTTDAAGTTGSAAAAITSFALIGV